MAAGDVQVQIVNSDATTISGALFAQRASVGISGAWVMTGVANGLQVAIASIEEDI